MEKTSASSTAIEIATVRRGSAAVMAGLGLPAWARLWPAYQRPTRHSTIMASSATSEKAATLCWPYGTTTNAARSGPIAEPALPPTWNTDWASPARPPEARRATREDSG